MTVEQIKRRLRQSSLAKQGTPATLASINDAEAALKVRFPEALRDYLLTFGWLEVGHWELMGLGEGIPEYLNLVAVTRSEREAASPSLPLNLLPLVNDGGGNLTCINVAEGDKAGEIVFWDHDLGRQQTPTLVSDDLSVWIDGLMKSIEGC